MQKVSFYDAIHSPKDEELADTQYLNTSIIKKKQMGPYNNHSYTYSQNFETKKKEKPTQFMPYTNLIQKLDPNDMFSPKQNICKMDKS